ncbi:hypothetical protein PRIPAC_74540 [Pristionchus pacificus]|uniref:Uncharacterized protein n=1 Tax=Pristionchus pacificus TaxID=54126 RepID=A0A2A6C8D0_PRIPA|nr:hypothetical protein PRIPAC_74540 [Pristionchus pacificus]|eukprot:PDM74465.1 hypothetical protein PRIPAC_41821 [Pristionchus pacificus]
MSGSIDHSRSLSIIPLSFAFDSRLGFNKNSYETPSGREQWKSAHWAYRIHCAQLGESTGARTPSWAEWPNWGNPNMDSPNIQLLFYPPRGFPIAKVKSTNRESNPGLKMHH